MQVVRWLLLERPVHVTSFDLKKLACAAAEFSALAVAVCREVREAENQSGMQALETESGFAYGHGFRGCNMHCPGCDNCDNLQLERRAGCAGIHGTRPATCNVYRTSQVAGFDTQELAAVTPSPI